MYKIDFSKPIHIHFIGIGGISMSGLAEILHEEGFTISGSDSKESDLTKTLAAKGIKVIYGQSADNITSGIDLVVYTAAIHESNPEFAAAKAAGIPMLTRAELLGQIMDNYDYSIAVAGTHGKTTTTHDQRDSSRRPDRSYHFRRWYFVIYPRQSACGRFRVFHLRGV